MRLRGLERKVGSDDVRIHLTDTRPDDGYYRAYCGKWLTSKQYHKVSRRRATCVVCIRTLARRNTA